MNAQKSNIAGALAVVLVLMLGVAGQRAVPFPRPEREHEHEQARRAQWFMRGRTSVDGLAPAEHMMRAMLHASTLPVVDARLRAAAARNTFGGSSTPGSWTELGPHPESDPFWGSVSGRITSIGLDLKADSTGNTAYVGEAFGGVWRCTAALSASPSCTPLTDAQASLSIGAVAVDPSTGGVIYAATGEQNNSIDSYYGVGILKSTNGGTNWSLVSSADNGAHPFVGASFSRIVVDPVTPTIVMAGAGSSTDVGSGTLSGSYTRGIYRSTDGGVSWTLAFSVTDNGATPTGFTCTDIVYDATSGAYYAAFRGHGFYKSTNRGVSWAALPTPFANNTQPCWTNCASGQLTNFHRASIATRSGTVYAVITADNGTLSTPTACTTGVTACDTGIVQSSNGGTTWTPIKAPTCTGLSPNACTPSDPLFDLNDQGSYDQFIAAPPNSGTLVVAGIDVWSTSPAGLNTTWSDLTQAYGTGTVHPDEHAIAMRDATTWLIGNDGGLWSTGNAGTGWTNGNATLGAIQFISASGDPTTQGVVFGGSQDNGTSQSPGTQAPSTWTEVWGGDGGYTATAGTGAGTMFYTENSDVNLQVAPNNGSFSLVVDKKTIADSAAFYVPYQPIPGAGTPQIAYGTCKLWLGPGTAAAPATAPRTDWHAISTDLTKGGNGSSTCAFDNTGDNYIQALAVAPTAPETIYIGTADGNLWKTTNAADAAPAWTAMSMSGAANTVWGAVAVQPINSDTLFIGRMGFGSGHVYKSNDGGQSFVLIDGNLADSPVNSIVVDPLHPRNVYVAQDAGVFVATDSGNGGASEVWQRVATNLPASAVLQLNFSPSTWTTRSLIAATHGRGAWVTAPLATGSPEFSVALTPANSSVNAGQAVSLTLNTQAFDGATAAIALTCVAPAGCTVSPSSISPGGSATVSVPAGAVQAGVNLVQVRATDGTNTHIQSASVTLTPPGVSISGTPATQSVNAGSSATYQLTVSSTGGYSGGANLSCSGAPSGATCSVSPTSVTVSPTASAPATLTVTTTARSMLPPGGPPTSGLPPLWLEFCAFALLLGFSGLWLRQFGRSVSGMRFSRRALWFSTATLVVLLASVACGHGNSSGTQAGTYTLTVTGSQSTTLGSGTVILTVK